MRKTLIEFESLIGGQQKLAIGLDAEVTQRVLASGRLVSDGPQA